MSGERTLVITRLLDAPRGIVFAAWIDPEKAARWWGPHGFVIESCAMDARVGGVWRRVMRGPDGAVRSARGAYREISAPERLVFTYAWEDEAGNPKHETVVTLTFAERGRQTELTLHQALFETTAARDEHRVGWAGCLDRFSKYLAARRD